jgi:hypothetical protein
MRLIEFQTLDGMRMAHSSIALCQVVVCLPTDIGAGREGERWKAPLHSPAKQVQ